jgi:hypothetical protein
MSKQCASSIFVDSPRKSYWAHPIIADAPPASAPAVLEKLKVNDRNFKI